MSTQKPKKHRIGKFSVSRYTIDERPALARTLMRDIIIVRAELDYRTDAIDYVGLCEKFDLVSELESTPQYLIEKQGFGGRKITRVSDGTMASMTVDIDDCDEDEDEPAPRKRMKPKRAASENDFWREDADEAVHASGTKTGRVSSPNAAFEDVDKVHPVVRAVEQSSKPHEPTDYLMITRELVGRKS